MQRPCRVVAETGLDDHAAGAAVAAAPALLDQVDVAVVGGGAIPDDDIPSLWAQGVVRIFTPGAALLEISRWPGEILDSRETACTG